MIIGLTYTGDEAKHQNYINWLKGDDDITIIELSVEKNNARAIADCDGLVLSGGVDIDPDLSGGLRDYPNKPVNWNRDRDRFEKSLYEYAQLHSMPLLGICRGMQLVNVLQGGILFDDLGPQNDIHKNNGTDKEHLTIVVENTLLSEIVNSDKGEVNSAHHQAIKTPGAGLLVNSIAADGTIEGIEWEDKTGKAFMLCVQWHPERMFSLPPSPFSENIRDRFIEEINQSIELKR